MRLGCCGTLEQAAEIYAAGFEFLEVNVQAVLNGDMSSKDWEAQAPDFAKFPLPIEAANCLVPVARPLIGPKRDMRGLQDYMQRIAKRAQIVGIKRLVFGSGGARRRPEGVTPEQATEQLIEFSAMCAEVCAHHEVMVVVEHLNRGECNTINTLEETRAICEAVGHHNLMSLVDSYHYGLEKENEQAVLDLGTTLHHVHVAEPDGRAEPGVPGSPATAFDFDDFFCLLRKAGYDERVSVEATAWSGSIAEKGPGVVRMLRDAWTKAGRCES